MKKPVRNLSLGERMKCEIAGALLHKPKVLFLDEPTIGLDVTAQRRIRNFLKEYNTRHGATVLLTSHYMADVEALCKRVVVIHHGRIIFDGDLATLAARFASHKTVVAEVGDFADWQKVFASYGEVVGKDNGHVSVRVPKNDVARVTALMLGDIPAITDVSIVDPPIEDAIEQIFSEQDTLKTGESEAVKA
jgi:ABC-2 type transport system ATP-binding protein